VITGFNTDVEFGGVTYHIQTEDKGVNSPIILSLVYDRGTILAAKRQPYNDLVEKGLDEKLLADRLKKQHKTICAAVKKGRIEDLMGLSEHGKGDRPAKRSKFVEEELPAVSKPSTSKARKNSKSTVLELEPSVEKPSSDPFTEVVAPIPMPKGSASFDESVAVPLIEDVMVLDLTETIPVEAVHVVSDLAGTDRRENNRLSVEFIGGGEFLGGSNCLVNVMVCRGTGRRVVEGAEVMVKVLGSSFRPLIFHSRTDRNGISTVALRLPNFTTGRASILVRALSQGEEVELRRAIIHG
jgi:hypothetical protein